MKETAFIGLENITKIWMIEQLHDVAINVLEAYEPKIPESYFDTELVLLANMSPRNQIDVLDQCSNAKYSIADTMDIWINNERDELIELLRKIDLLVINESEAPAFHGNKEPRKGREEINGPRPKECHHQDRRARLHAVR